MDDGFGGQFVSLIGGEFDVLQTSMLISNGIVKGGNYRLKYRCKNINGWSDFSPIAYIMAAEVPAIPKAPTLIQATATTMTLQLYKPEDTGGSEVTSFSLYINDGNSESEPTILVQSYTDNNLVHTLDLNGDDTSLLSGGIYKFAFVATNAIGNSQKSAYSTIGLCSQPGSPGVPTINPSLTNGNQIGVDWTPSPSSQSPCGTVTGYSLYMMDPRDGEWIKVFNGENDYPTVTSYIVREGIAPGLPYRFKTVGAYLNGHTPESTESVIYSCTAPLGLAAPTLVEATSTYFTLTWKQPLSNGGCPIQGFALHMNDGNGGQVFTEIDSGLVRN